MERVDIAVIGAGVTGLACAARLAAEDRTLVVFDKAERYGTETSSRNSEVLHAGLYYPPNSLKNRLCHEGRRMLYALGEDAGIFTQKTGKYIVATNEEEASRLETLREGAHASGAEGITLVSGEKVRSAMDGLQAHAALWSPESGIIDSEELMKYFYQKAEKRGAMFLFKSGVTRAERTNGGYLLEAGGESLQAQIVINAAGLYSDQIAALVGIDTEAAGYTLHWCAGRYFRLKKEIPLPHLIYPIPMQHGLGIHLTPDRAGRIRLGPDSEFVSKIDYSIPERLTREFADSVRRYWPSLRDEDLIPDTAGIRPKRAGPDGGFQDFIIAEESEKDLPGWINLIGIDSPGLTAAPAVAEQVAAMIE